MTPMEMKAQAVNTEMPNGKRLADCTHEEIMTFGELCIELAKSKAPGGYADEATMANNYKFVREFYDHTMNEVSNAVKALSVIDDKIKMCTKMLDAADGNMAAPITWGNEAGRARKL